MIDKAKVIGEFSPPDQMLRMKVFAVALLGRRILLRKTDCLLARRRKRNMPAARSHSFVLARFKLEVIREFSPSDQMLRICRTSCFSSAGEAPQNEYVRCAAAFIYACALQIGSWEGEV